MKMLHLAIGMAVASGLAACETAFSGPLSGQTTFVTDGTFGAGGRLAAAESCLLPAPAVPIAGDIGAGFPDPAPSNEGC